MTFLAAVGGLALAFIAWWGASGTGELDKQVTWTVVSVVAVIVIGFGSFSWLLAGRRAVGIKRASLLERLEEAIEASSLGAHSGADDRWFRVVAGSDRYHRDGCLLVRGKGAERVASGSRRGLRPCEMCEPSS